MAMNAKISVFIVCAEAIIYLLLYYLHDCTFKTEQENGQKWTFTKKTMILLEAVVHRCSSK